MMERRQHVRYPASVPGRCIQDGGAEFPIQVVNISTVALLARATKAFIPRRAGRLRLQLNEGLFECTAVCVRASDCPPWEGAFLFTDVAPESAGRLETFLERLKAGIAP